MLATAREAQATRRPCGKFGKGVTIAAMPARPPGGALGASLLDWYAANARPLPWREPGASAWSILVSEIMLQQTPVSRVLAAHLAWLARWPTPSSLARASAADALRQWGGLGYPRRAIALHTAAGVIESRHGGEVPSDVAALRELPGVGSYTAAAVAAFAFGHRIPVLDTNVRRVLARLVSARQRPGPATSAAERTLAESLLPADGAEAARFSVALMELGAVCCTANRPACRHCPLADACGWRRAGFPPAARTGRAPARYENSDRQCRGRLLAVLRSAPGPVRAAGLSAAWPEAAQRERALASLISDGLVTCRGGLVGLPGED